MSGWGQWNTGLQEQDSEWVGAVTGRLSKQVIMRNDEQIKKIMITNYVHHTHTHTHSHQLHT